MRLLYVSRWWSHHDVRFFDAWTTSGIDVVALSVDGTAPGDSAYPGADLEVRISSAVNTFRPDIVHAGPLTDVAPLVRAVWSGPLIVMSWGFDLMHEIDADLGALERATGALKSADCIIVDNNGPRARAVALRADESRIVQFPWGIDLSFFSPGPSTFRERHGIATEAQLVFASRKHEELYCTGDIVDAFLSVAREHPYLDLALAGSGSLTDSYRARVTAAGLSNRVHFVGDLTATDLLDAHRAANLYVSASSVDGTSISLLEAMACGTPVCVSRIAGNDEWVGPETGTTFAVGDVSALAREMSSLGDPDADVRRARASSRALREVRQRADWSRTTARLADIARATIAQKADRSTDTLEAP